MTQVDLEYENEVWLDEVGNALVSYCYDAWGNTLSVQYGTSNTDAASCMAAYNPLRYRSYYRDDEGFFTYYLQSRYYENPFNRFLNADIPDMRFDNKVYRKDVLKC